MKADAQDIDPVRRPVPEWRGLVLRYGGAVLAVAAAAGLRGLVHDVLGDTLAYITFHPLVALVAMLAGGGPGVLATVLSGVVADAWVVAPDGRHDAADVVGMGFFAASGLVMSTMGEMLRRTRREKAGLEDQVAGCTNDLQRANASLRTEVEDRRRAEQSLRRSERRFRTVFDHAPTGIAITTLDAKIEECNPAYCAILGYTEEELRRVPFASLVYPEDREVNLAELRRLRAGEVSFFEAENRYVHKSGRPVWVRKWVSLLPDEIGKPAHIIMALVTDMTERRRAETELRREHELSEAIIDTAPVIVLLLGPDGRILRLNPFMERLTGWTLAEARGRDWFDTFLPARDRERIRGVFRQALGTERTHANVNPIVTRAGVEREIEWYDAPVRGAGGELIGLLCVGKDVTAHKQAEEALRASERRWRDLAEALPQLVWTCAPDGRCDFLSRQWVEFTGRAEVGQLGYGWLDQVHPDDRDRLRSLWGESVAAGTTFDIEFRIRRADGAHRWFKTRAVPVRGADGRVAKWFGSNTDIEDLRRATDELRASEERLRAILDTAADGILTIDRDGVIESVNPAAERMFGYAAAEMTGRNVSMLMPPPYREGHDGYLERYRRTGEARVIGVGREVEGRRKDGTVFPVQLAVSEVSHLPLFTGIVHDITRRKELERDVVEIVSMEQRRIGQDLHDSVAQELTALTLLADDLAEILRTDPAGGVSLVERMAGGLGRSQQQLRAVLRGLLPVAVDAGGLMAALADLADRTGREGPAACVFDCPEPIAVADNVVATQVYLIAQEAVRNAVRHGRPRSVRITLESNHHLTLRVRDDGAGMPARPTDIQGLGLRIMRNRAAIIGAVLTIGSAEPTGTLVTCALARKWHEQQPTG